MLDSGQEHTMMAFCKHGVILCICNGVNFM